MSKAFTVKVLEQCQVSPPPNSTPATSIHPLTFLDLPWLFFSPNQTLFFYKFPRSISHFTNNTLPKLKHSLSNALHHYYPFASNFVSSPEMAKPQLVYTHGNSISLTIAESNGDFDHFCSNHPREVYNFYPLVPKLTLNSCGQKEIPLLAIQTTFFPDVGICIGLSYHHVIADGRTFNNFMRTWASYCSFEASTLPQKSLPFYDRSVIIYTNGLEEVFLKEWRRRRLEQNIVVGREAKVGFSSMVRATFLMGATEMEKIKHFIIAWCKKKNQSQPVHLSAYVLTCAFVWVCLLKTQQTGSEKVIHEDPFSLWEV